MLESQPEPFGKAAAAFEEDRAYPLATTFSKSSFRTNSESVSMYTVTAEFLYSSSLPSLEEEMIQRTLAQSVSSKAILPIVASALKSASCFLPNSMSSISISFSRALEEAVTHKQASRITE